MSTPTDLSDFDLSNGKIIELNIDGKIFKYKLPTNEDELSWAPEYMEIVGTKEINGVEVADVKVNFGKLNFCKLQNIVDVPYSQDQVLAVINVDKEYKYLNKNQKKEFLDKLNSNLIGKIVSALSKVEKSETDLKKN